MIQDQRVLEFIALDNEDHKITARDFLFTIKIKTADGILFRRRPVGRLMCNSNSPSNFLYYRPT